MFFIMSRLRALRITYLIKIYKLTLLQLEVSEIPEPD